MQKQTRLFTASIIALAAMAFGFVVRGFLLNDWGVIFDLTETQKGSIQGAGLYPQALSIIFFSLIIDRLGYGRTLAFAFIAHVVSAVITITATSYVGLYVGTFIFSLAAGAIEAAVNPIVATLYPQSKTRHLNMLHAGWPGGLVLGGILAILVSTVLGTAGSKTAWRWEIALYLIPTAIYGFMMLGQKFPVQERVAAGITYTDMLKEFGWAGCLLVSIFIAFAVDEILRVFNLHLNPAEIAIIAIVPTILFAWKIRSFGRPVFVFLMLVMVLSAATEIGTDSWISALMTPVLKEFGSNAGNCVIIYTSAIMLVLRFYAGPIVHRVSPLGLLTACAAICAIGLFWLGHTGNAPLMIILAATFYGFGKTFFWPTTLGIVSEQFPKGGALTLSAVAGVGMISVGVLANPLLGTLQDHFLDRHLEEQNPALHAEVAGSPESKFGLTYQPLDEKKIAALPEADKAAIEDVRTANNRSALAMVSVLPLIMVFCYGGLLLYFRSRGGYKQVHMEMAGYG